MRVRGASACADEGEWRFGKREGHGRAQYASKDGYEGQWKADKKQGFGTFWSASGEIYEGEWLTGTYEGRGTYLYASSDVRVPRRAPARVRKAARGRRAVTLTNDASWAKASGYHVCVVAPPGL